MTAYAKQRQKPIEAVLDELVPRLPDATPKNAAEMPQHGTVSLDEFDEDAAAPPLYDTLNEEEFEKCMDGLAELGRGWGSLPNAAFDRETLYEESV